MNRDRARRPRRSGRAASSCSPAFLFVWAAAAFGSTRLGSNIAPLILFVVWWVGLVPISVLFGNVWRELNPWATLARAVRIPATRERELPHWLGVWPAAVLLVAWAWLELVYPAPGEPRLMAVLIALYTIATLAGMYRYGIERWLDSGEMFTRLHGHDGDAVGRRGPRPTGAGSGSGRRSSA